MYRSGATCLPCDTSCMTCDGGSPTDCLSCAAVGKYLAADGSCAACQANCDECSRTASWQTILFEDFNDGVADGWTLPYGCSGFGCPTAQNGVYVMKGDWNDMYLPTLSVGSASRIAHEFTLNATANFSDIYLGSANSSIHVDYWGDTYVLFEQDGLIVKQVPLTLPAKPSQHVWRFECDLVAETCTVAIDGIVVADGPFATSSPSSWGLALWSPEGYSNNSTCDDYRVEVEDTDVGTICTSCSAGFYLYQGNCVDACPPGTIPNGSVCVAETTPSSCVSIGGGRALVPGMVLGGGVGFTLEGWFLLHSYKGGNIFRHWETCASEGFSVNMSDTGTISIHGANASNKYEIGGILPTNHWFHLATSFTSAGNQLYVNGTYIGGGSGTTGQSPSCTLGIFGCDSEDDSTDLDGFVDEVRVSSGRRYSENFTPSPTLAADASTMALWHFDEGLGTSCADASGNGYEAHLQTAVWQLGQCIE